MKIIFSRLIITVRFILFLFFVSNALRAQENAEVLHLADSLAKETLEKEGLFTVLGGLKPISTVEHFQFPIDTISKAFLNPEKVVRQIQLLHKSLEFLSGGNIGFAIVPFKAVYGDMRRFQLLVYNKASIKKTIETYADFFIHRGVLSDTDPNALLVMVEFEEKIDRFRAYGYLFGYPAHAVDFFVEAAEKEEKTGVFVKRSFFQIPVASSETGRFVYALPENQEPEAADLKLMQKAGEILETYKRLRDEVLDEKNDLAFLQLFQFIKENLGECNFMLDDARKIRN